jgi:hypothetical protein
VSLAPGVKLPPGTLVSPESGESQPADPAKLPPNVDALLFPGQRGGLLKIYNYTDATITGFRLNGRPLFTTKFRALRTSGPTWYPAGTRNPWKVPIPGYVPPRPKPDHTTMDDPSKHS